MKRLPALAALLASIALCGPAASQPAPGSWTVPLEIVGEGFVRGGIPFPKGALMSGDPVRRADGVALDSEVLATWGDGSVRWLLVETVGSGPVTLEPGLAVESESPGAPRLEEGELVLTLQGVPVDLSRVSWTEERRTGHAVRLRAKGKTPVGIDWFGRLERTVDGPDRLRLELRNPTPTTVTRGQPTCLYLGCDGTIPLTDVTLTSPSRTIQVRWADENGATDVPGGVSLIPTNLELRPGEQYGWEIVLGEGDPETPLLEYPAAWACDSGAFGPLVPVNEALFGDYERNNLAGVKGIRGGRCRPHWRNPRDHGEDQRDWDGGVIEKDFQTHNNEYEVHLAYAKQRLRTMGIQAVSRDWHYLGLTGSRHFANVDIYHVHEGPLGWLHGAPFQHVKHGGSGQGTMHRSTFSPNMGHYTGRGMLAWYYLTGDPLLLDSFLEVAENTRWRVANGPGMPGASDTQGAMRNPAMALGILTDAWIHTRDQKFLDAAHQVNREAHAQEKLFVTKPEGTEWKVRPWMLGLYVVTLDEFIDTMVEYGRSPEADVARESTGLYKTFLRKNAKVDGDTAQFEYQLSTVPGKAVDLQIGSWNVVLADAMVDYYPDVALGLFRYGSRTIWHTKHPNGKYAKLNNHTVLAGWGHRVMKAMAEGEIGVPRP